MSWLIRINSSNYTGKYPARLTLTQPQPDGRNLNGAPIRGQGKPEAVLEWDYMTLTDYQTWTGYISSGNLSATLSDFVIPDDDSAGTVAGNANHTAYSSAELWQPEKGETVEYDGTRIIKDVRIRVTELTE